MSHDRANASSTRKRITSAGDSVFRPGRGVLAVAAAVTALAASAVPTLAFGAFSQKIGSETWTDASGNGDGPAHELSTTAAFYGLRSMTLWQYSHRPCALGADEAALHTDNVVSLDPLHACDPTGGQEWKRADVGPGHFVTAIAACRGKSKDLAIHGVRLWSAVLGRDGKLVPVKAPVEVEFRECGTWQPKRECPSGSVATGIRGYWTDKDHGMEGLSLRCHQIELIASNGTRHTG